MFAVIKTGGKQYKVAKDDVIVVEKLPGESGSEIRLTEVLLVADDKGASLGTPLIDGAAVNATVVAQRRGDKVIVFKKKRRKGYRRTQGHRQDETVLRITDILRDGAKAKAKKAETKKAEAKKPVAKKPAAKKVAAKKPPAKAKTGGAAKKPAAKKTARKTKE